MTNPTKLDRTLQLHVLRRLAELAPYGTENLEKEAAPDGTDHDTLMANLLYLQEHTLITLGFQRAGGFGGVQGFVETHETHITARGQDFLADDGGLSAILGTVTIKLHDDTIKDLIEAKIHDSDLAPKDKQRYLDQLRSLPAESTKHLALKLIDAGLSNAPAAWTAIKTALSTYL